MKPFAIIKFEMMFGYSAKGVLLKRNTQQKSKGGILQHIKKWLTKTSGTLNTADSKTVEIWELKYGSNDVILSSWAKHFRNHYCSDNQIDSLCSGTGLTHTEYLNQIKFPDSNRAPGPSIRAGDFGEILVADFLEYILSYWVPRTRYDNKNIRNESTKGSDIIGFRFVNSNTINPINPMDELAIFEAKAQFSSSKSSPRLQDAVDDSGKDKIRKAETLNAIKQRFLDRHEEDNAKKIERFQNEEDSPYKEIYGAVALFDNRFFNHVLESSTDSSSHPSLTNLTMIVIKGDDMMKLVNELYKRAADEA